MDHNELTASEDQPGDRQIEDLELTTSEQAHRVLGGKVREASSKTKGRHRRQRNPA